MSSHPEDGADHKMGVKHRAQGLELARQKLVPLGCFGEIEGAHKSWTFLPYSHKFYSFFSTDKDHAPHFLPVKTELF